MSKQGSLNPLPVNKNTICEYIKLAKIILSKNVVEIIEGWFKIAKSIRYNTSYVNLNVYINPPSLLTYEFGESFKQRRELKIDMPRSKFGLTIVQSDDTFNANSLFIWGLRQSLFILRALCLFQREFLHTDDRYQGSSINHVDRWGEGGLAKWPFYYISNILQKWPRRGRVIRNTQNVVYGWPFITMVNAAISGNIHKLRDHLRGGV